MLLRLGANEDLVNPTTRRCALRKHGQLRGPCSAAKAVTKRTHAFRLGKDPHHPRPATLYLLVETFDAVSGADAPSMALGKG